MSAFVSFCLVVYICILTNKHAYVGVVTSDGKARMEWKQYWRNVVKRYQVIVEGWPADIPFCNLSETSSALPDLENLLRKWRCGKIYWRKLSEAELNRLDLERDAQIENGELAAPTPRRRRSDYGKKRPRTKDGTDIARERKRLNNDIDDSSEEDRPPATDQGPSRKRRRSRKVVEDSETDSGEEDQPPTTPGTSSEQS